MYIHTARCIFVSICMHIYKYIHTHMHVRIYMYIYISYIYIHIEKIFHFLKLHSLHLPDLEIEGCSLRTISTYDSTRIKFLQNVHADVPRFLRCNIFPTHRLTKRSFCSLARYQTFKRRKVRSLDEIVVN